MRYSLLFIYLVIPGSLLAMQQLQSLTIPDEQSGIIRQDRRGKVASSLRLQMQIRSDTLLPVAIYCDSSASSLYGQVAKLTTAKVYPSQHLINTHLSPSAVELVSTWEQVLRITPISRVYRNSGAALSQGDAALGTDELRRQQELDGSTVKVGVLSDTYNANNGELAGINANELPGPDNTNGFTTPVQVLADGASGIDEGRAMLEIIHDLAPGATLAFHTALGGRAAFASGIRALRNADCEVIVDDIAYLAQPFFQDGLVAQAADEVNADGALYFSSAGNNADLSYEADYVVARTIPIGDTDYQVHDFDPGAGIDAFQQISIPAGETLLLDFQWNDRFTSINGSPGPSSDLGIFLVDSAITTVVASSDFNNIEGDPVEILEFTNPASASSTTFNILIGLRSGSIPDRIKYISFEDLRANEFATNSATCFGHPNAAGAIAVGAAPWFETPNFGENPPILEPFSSRGGVPILRNSNGNELGMELIRDKPNVVGPDGGNTSFFGQQINDGDDFPNFFGTSASAPHAAAFAALLLEAFPQALPSDIRTALEGTAIDMEDPGFDSASGNGFINVQAAFNDLEARVGALPLEDLQSFTGRATQQGNTLEWTLSRLDRIDQIGLLRFFSGEQAPEEIARFAPLYAHQYLDAARLPVPTVYYQLAIHDRDGSVSYSATISVQQKSTQDFSLYPNPAKDQVTLLSDGIFTGYTPALINSLGRRVQVEPKAGGEVGALWRFDLQDVEAGIYLIGFPEVGQFQRLLIQR